MKHKYILLILFIPVFISCSTFTDKDTSNDWKKAKTIIPADENLRPVLLQFKQIFEHEYPETQIDFKFEANDSLIRQFVLGNYNNGIISRYLTSAEKNNSSITLQSKIKERVFAFSGIALVANSNFSDSIIDLKKIPDYLINNSREIIFDNASSGIARQMQQFIQIKPETFRKAKSVGSYEDIIHYIKIKQNAIGCIPFSKISDIDNKQVQSTLSTIKLLDIRWEDKNYAISQQSIAYGHYPLWQPLNFIMSSNHEPITEAFMNFLMKSKASKILLKAGLVPVNIPVREYIISDTLAISK